MANENIIGRMKCPCCGAEMQDLKINKNGNLYLICDNGCRVNLSKQQTKKFKPVLEAGRNINENGLLITSLRGVNNGTRTEQPRTDVRTIARTTARPPVDAGNTAVRRTDRQPAAAGNTDAKPSRAGGFINWLNSDDDE